MHLCSLIEFRKVPNIANVYKPWLFTSQGLLLYILLLVRWLLLVILVR